jgi:hypothetical protein
MVTHSWESRKFPCLDQLKHFLNRQKVNTVVDNAKKATRIVFFYEDDSGHIYGLDFCRIHWVKWDCCEDNGMDYSLYSVSVLSYP